MRFPGCQLIALSGKEAKKSRSFKVFKNIPISNDSKKKMMIFLFDCFENSKFPKTFFRKQHSNIYSKKVSKYFETYEFKINLNFFRNFFRIWLRTQLDFETHKLIWFRFRQEFEFQTFEVIWIRNLQINLNSSSTRIWIRNFRNNLNSKLPS